jgi:HrpA-like RNA helicase
LDVSRRRSDGIRIEQNSLRSRKEIAMTRNALPIDAFENELISLVDAHQVVIIVAETGAGKSTRVPQFLLKAGYKVLMTQPRRMAARTIAERIAFEVGCEIGKTVGYRTAEEKDKSSAETRCLVATDGLALKYQLHDNFHADVLVLDEVHEWNSNMEVLIAWMKRRISEGDKTKVVIQSATLDAEELSQFFGNAPVVRVTGRSFEVTERKAGFSLEDDVIRLLQDGHNVLVFQPGKGEIEDTIMQLQASGVNAEFIPLHGEQTPGEQSACFKRYDRPMCIVATSVAQTSLTIPNIDAVVDSGVEKRMTVRNGIEGLFTNYISLADREQRKGRAGRTRPGIYIDHCPLEAADRLDFKVPEIRAGQLDQVVLRLTKAGLDVDTLDFFHIPDALDIEYAKHVLVKLGCMDGKGRITKMGSRIADLPLSVRSGRMLLEAVERGVTGDVISIVAILEVGGIIDRKGYGSRLADGERDSDCLAHLRVLQRARDIPKELLKANGVHIKNYFKTLEQRRLIQEALARLNLNCSSTGDRDAIIKSICAGFVDKVYTLSGSHVTSLDQMDRRELDKRSCVYADYGSFVVGKPLDLGRHNLLTLNTVVTLDQLTAVAPALFSVIEGDSPFYDEDNRCVMSYAAVSFDGRVVSKDLRQDPDHPEAARVFAEWLADRVLRAAA